MHFALFILLIGTKELIMQLHLLTCKVRVQSTRGAWREGGGGGRGSLSLRGGGGSCGGEGRAWGGVGNGVTV